MEVGVPSAVTASLKPGWAVDNKRVIVAIASDTRTRVRCGTADKLRELGPRAGRSAWRALYRQVGEVFVAAEED